ncbi:MAG: LiaI-LiaF-like domain-containing protein, partial [Candidatus Bipolaricaulia bacterium]
MGESKHNKSPYRSLFWPIVIIGIGLIALLRNLDIISGENLVTLLYLWPVFLIAIGLNFILGRRSPQLSALIGIGTVALVIVLVTVGPSLGRMETDRYIESIGGATSARVNLNLRSGRTTVDALSNSNDLIDAELTYRGEVEFTARGDQEKVINLRHIDDRCDFGFFDSIGMRSEIGLSPDVPIDLDINTGSGTTTLDLSELQLTDLSANSGSGRTDLELPAAGARYSARLNSGSGTFDVDVAEDAIVDMNINLGSGRFGVDIGDGADVDARGTWETPNFNSAERQI